MPDARPDTAVPDEEVEEGEKLHRVEAVLGARFPGINKKLSDFNFQRHYGAEVKEIKTRNGQRYVDHLEDVVLREGDTLVVMADDTFIPTWENLRYSCCLPTAMIRILRERRSAGWR